MNRDWFFKYRFILFGGIIGLLIPNGIKYGSQLIDYISHKDPKVIGYYEKDGVILENVTFDKRRPNPYNIDNKVFKTDQHIDYAYEINNGEYKIIRNPETNSHKIQNTSKTIYGDEIVLDFFRIAVNDQILVYGKERELIAQTNVSMYVGANDTIMASYNYPTIIENNKNVWLDSYWWELFYNNKQSTSPAFIKRPYKIGHKWQYTKEYDAGCGIGIVEIESQYRIDEIVSISTKHGELNCYVIRSTGQSRYGKSHLISYFNEEYGFVRLEYKMPDGLEINFFQI